jgi:hypothetical protein
VRAIIRDGADAFVGSLSLRRADLDERRELGVIVRDATAVRRMIQTFNTDWQKGAPKKGCDCEDEEEERGGRKIAKAS